MPRKPICARCSAGPYWSNSTLGFLGMFHAAEFVSPGLATVIANAQPLLAAILAHAILNERLEAKGRIGFAIGLGGIVAIAWPGLGFGAASGYLLGVAYIALAAAGVSVGNVAMKHLSSEIDAITAMGLQLLFGAVPLAILSASTEDWATVTSSAEFLVTLVLLVVTGVAFVQLDANGKNSGP